MNIAILLGGIALAVGLFFGGFKSGEAVKQVAWDQERAARSDAALVRVEHETKVEVQTVTKYVDRIKTITVAAEETKNEIQIIVRSDCVLPPDFMRELRAVSRNTTAEAAGIAEDASERAGCRAALEVLRQSYANHYADAAQLNAIIERDAALSSTTDKGATP